MKANHSQQFNVIQYYVCHFWFPNQTEKNFKWKKSTNHYKKSWIHVCGFSEQGEPKKRSEWKHFALSISQHSEQLWFWQRSESNDFLWNKNNLVSIETRFNKQEEKRTRIAVKKLKISFQSTHFDQQNWNNQSICRCSLLLFPRATSPKKMLIKHSWAQNPTFNVGNVNNTKKNSKNWKLLLF